MAFPSTIFEDIGLSQKTFSNALSIVSTASTAATCAEVPSELNIITTGTTSTGGYRLPPQNSPGRIVGFINNSGTICTVYPPTGGKIDGGSVDAGVTVSATTGSFKQFVMDGTALSWRSMQVA